MIQKATSDVTLRGVTLRGVTLGVVLCLLLAGCGTGPSSPSPHASSSSGSSSTLSATGVSGVHVYHGGGGPYLANGRNEFVLLRGVDDNALVQYPSDYREAPPITRGDLNEMAALGFNFLRLPVSWSRIMVHPGVINDAYLAEIQRVVRWAKDVGIGVLVDMHQDNYSTVVDFRHESDGAPPWAVVTNGVPCTSASTTKCMFAAFSNFWKNTSVSGRPLQSWYLEATIAAARAAGAGSANSNVVGVELMNEPVPAGPNPFEEMSLYPFYRRMITGLRASGIVAPIWFEPSIVRDATNNAISAATPFSTDPNLVYAVHIYTGVFSPPHGPTASIPAMAVSYSNAAKEAAAFNTPFFVDEYGSNPTNAWNSWLTAQISMQNRYRVGSGFWLWKQRTGRWYNWAVVRLNGSLRTGTLRAQILSEPHVDSVPGDLVATSSTSTQLTATVDGPGGTVSIWGGTVITRGATSAMTHTLERVTVDARPVAAHCKMVSFSTPALAMHGCVLVARVPPGKHVIVASR
ncbi:MAG: glycoside hydrolase family 5 protein [Acidimicrobiales bacterium]